MLGKENNVLMSLISRGCGRKWGARQQTSLLFRRMVPGPCGPGSCCRSEQPGCAGQAVTPAGMELPDLHKKDNLKRVLLSSAVSACVK